MNQQRNWSSVFLALGVLASAITFVTLFHSQASAQSGVVDNGDKAYILTSSSGTWGAAEDDAVAAAGGSKVFGHVGSGLGSATSGNPNFIKALGKTGLFGPIAVDQVVQWVQPGGEQAIDDDLTNEVITGGNETFSNLQWSMQAINANGAWSQGYDGSGVRVAVIDGGFCPNHIDLAPNLDVAHSKSFVPGFTYDQDTGGPSSFRHACHVAGIIAAADNNIGTIGVAPKATIISVKALHGGSGSFAAVIQGILYASDPISAGGAGADIINLSLGALFARGGGNTGAGQLVAATARAVNYATDHNVLVVVAAGNNGVDLDHSTNLIDVPAQSGSAIAVSATGPHGYAVGYPNGATDFISPAYYTNYGHSVVWVAAPGGNDNYTPATQVCSIPRIPTGSVTTNCFVFDLIISPGNTANGYFFADGTSMAAPHVAGVAALIKQKYPGISVGDLKNQIANTANDEGKGGADPFYGHGFIDAGNAVTQPLAVTNLVPIDKSGQATVAQALPARVQLAAGRGLTSGSWFAFNLPAAGHVRLELFDVAGRSVATLYDGAAPMGRTTINWNGVGAGGQQVARGAYFARIRTAGDQATTRLVVVGQ
jgi:subtilisin family serine protease